jgi:hypothetical protein
MRWRYSGETCHFSLYLAYKIILFLVIFTVRIQLVYGCIHTASCSCGTGHTRNCIRLTAGSIRDDTVHPYNCNRCGRAACPACRFLVWVGDLVAVGWMWGIKYRNWSRAVECKNRRKTEYESRIMPWWEGEVVRSGFDVWVAKQPTGDVTPALAAIMVVRR